jgi:hypothetical protein
LKERVPPHEGGHTDQSHVTVYQKVKACVSTIDVNFVIQLKIINFR